MGIPVRINGAGPFEFLVDTGSQITILEPSLAAELHIAPVGHAGVVSGVRRAVVETVQIDEVAVGPNRIEHPLAAVQSMAQFQLANPRIRGVLGETFLARFDVLIDNAHSILCLDLTGQMQKDLQGERIALVTQSESPDDSPLPKPLLVPVRLGSGSRNLVLRLDSGANVPQLYVNTLDTAPWVQTRNAVRAHVTGSAAEYFVLMPPQDMRIGKHTVRDLVFATPVKAKQNVGFRGEDGLLPTELFKRVFVSYAREYVIFDPR